MAEASMMAGTGGPERERLAAEVAAERARLRSVILRMPAPVALLVGPEHRHALVNDAFRRISGGGRDVTGLTVREAFPELEGQGIFERFDHVYRTGEPWAAPESLVRYDRDGTGIRDTWFDVRFEPVRDADGRVTGILNFAVDVTDQVLARRGMERLLEDSERARAELASAAARFEAVLGSIADAFYLLDREWRFTYVNDAAEPLLQTTRAWLLGRTLWEAFPGVIGSPFEGPYREAMATGRVTAAEAYFPPLGTWFDVRTYPWAGGLMVHFRDIGARKAAEVERDRLLAEAEAARAAADLERRRLQAVIEQLPIGVHVAEAPSGRLVLDNAALREICGEAPRSEQAGDHGADYSGHYPVGHPRAGEPIPSDAWPLARALATGESVGEELVDLRRADGTRRLVSVSAVPVRDADGRIVGGVATNVDVTERERILAETEAARERVTAVLESIGDAFYAVDADFRFTYVNHKAEAVWGRGRESLVGRHFWTEFPVAVGSESYRMHLRVMAERRPVHYETVSPLLGRWIEVSIYPETGGGLACYFRDVTIRKDAEAAREAAVARAEAAQAEAEAANQAKSEFLAVMSHELRTPLNAIGGYAELMEMGIRGAITPQQREDLRRIQQSQRHLLGLINEVLNYAKLETGTVTYDLVPLRVRDALTGAEALVAPQAQAKGLTLAVLECPPALTVRADAEKVRQVLVNLLSNAVKFTDRGGRVELACAEAGERVHVLVRDTGIGIATDQRERIFDPFVQVRADLTRPHEGTGLGLAISRDLARGMGGDLTMESAPGAGSTFTLVLPRE